MGMRKTGQITKDCRTGPKTIYLRMSKQRIYKRTDRLQTAHLLRAIYVQEEGVFN